MIEQRIRNENKLNKVIQEGKALKAKFKEKGVLLNELEQKTSKNQDTLMKLKGKLKENQNLKEELIKCAQKFLIEDEVMKSANAIQKAKTFLEELIGKMQAGLH